VIRVTLLSSKRAVAPAKSPFGDVG